MRVHMANIVINCHNLRGLADFWGPMLGWQPVPLGEQYVSLTNSATGQPNVLLQHVPEQRRGKNRVHVDVHTHEAPEAVVARFVALGATLGPDHHAFNKHWTVMQDPEGNALCVVHAQTPESGGCQTGPYPPHGVFPAISPAHRPRAVCSLRWHATVHTRVARSRRCATGLCTMEPQE